MMMISAAHSRLLCTKVPIQFDHFSLHEKSSKSKTTNKKKKKKETPIRYPIRKKARSFTEETAVKDPKFKL